MYAAIEQIADPRLATAAVCDALSVSRAAYYAWRTAAPTTHAARDAELGPLVHTIFWRHRRRYGARRIASELADLGQPCSPRRVAKLLKNQGLRAQQPRSFAPRTTDSRHRLGYSPNLLVDAPAPTRLDQLWVGDITYVPLVGGSFCYLATLMDRVSRAIVGWRLEESLSDELTRGALRMAIERRQPPAGLIHHTDRGGQYASTRYRSMLRRAGFRQSMSRAGDCYDNAFMESCFGTIKTELEMTEYQDCRAARRELAAYVSYYLHDRKHSALDYLTPSQAERLLQAGHRLPPT
jgi:transposase InsO family protein